LRRSISSTIGIPYASRAGARSRGAPSARTRQALMRHA
jgi:hypothetical protein